MIEELFARNRSWAAGRVAADPGYFARLAAQQRPGLLWIGCADSRVSADMICGLEPGEVFVHRNVANVVHPADLNLLTVLDFAVRTLEIRTIVVCGHLGCSGVRAALDQHRHGLVDHWLRPIRDVADQHAEELVGLEPGQRHDRLCELNVKAQVAELARSPILHDAWARGLEVTVHGWVYGLGDGLLRDLACSVTATDHPEDNPHLLTVT